MNTRQEGTDSESLVRLIRHEYDQWPALRLTLPQVRRLWGVETATCEEALEALIEAAVLSRLADRTYVLAPKYGSAPSRTATADANPSTSIGEAT